MRVRQLAVAVTAIMGAAWLLAACDTLAKRTPGEQLYRKHCAECHGLNGSGNTPGYMGNFNADLLDDSWYTISGAPNSIDDVIKDGVFAKMPANPELTDKEVRQITDWVLQLRGETR